MSFAGLHEKIDAVVFDVGETLVDETRAWTQMARKAGVAPFTLMAALGALIERRESHRQVWSMLGVEDRPVMPPIGAQDLYPDAVDCVRGARLAGLIVGIAGNQPHGVSEQLAGLDLAPSFIASSADWGVAKPSREFFERIVDASGVDATRILYVGDRVDNDILPAHEFGMLTAFIRRGPWGLIHAEWPEADLADLRLDSLAELAVLLRGEPSRAR